MTKKKEVRRVVLYARVSDPKQLEKDLSIPTQLNDMRRVCKERQYQVVEVFQDKGKSARDEHRADFQRMLAFAQDPANQIDAVLVLSTSRFMRNVEAARIHKRVLAKAGVRVIAVTQETTDDPQGQLIEGMFELFDEYESKANSIRTSMAMKTNAQNGNMNGSRPSFGFMRERLPIPGKEKRYKSRPIHDPAELETHREVFRCYAAEKGAKNAAQNLNERGFRYRKGKLWSKDLVLKVISDPVAIGEYYWGRTDSRGDKIELRDRSEWVLIPCEPTISRELWELVQRIRRENDPEHTPGRTASSPLLLAGLVSCGSCGASYQLETSGKQSASGAPYRYYNCRSFIRTGKAKCAGFRIPTEAFERQVVEHLTERAFSPEMCRQIVKDIVEETGLLREKAGEQRRAIKAELEEVKKRISRWEDAFESGQLDLSDGVNRLRELRDRQRDLQEELEKVVPIALPLTKVLSDSSIAAFQDTIRRLFIGNKDVKVSQSHLRHLVSRIIVRGRRIEIVSRSENVASMMISGNGGGGSGGTAAGGGSSGPPVLATGGAREPLLTTQRTA